MKNELLPIGSIITVGNIDVMICAYFRRGKLINNEQYDYACCLYPSGMEKDAILVKKDSITRVKFIGYQDGSFVEFKKIMLGEKNE